MRAAARHFDRGATDGALPRAVVKKSRLNWWLWLIPIAAAGVCVWFVCRDYIAAGPSLIIYFRNAEGVEAENTNVKYRGADVGVVKSVVLSKDTKIVTVKARLDRSAASLARAGSVFWIVRPEVKVGAISGLRTIVSGEYVAVQPGAGPSTNVFTGSEREPLPDEPGALDVTLMSPALGSLQERSPVFYRGLQVGEIIYYQLAPDSRGVVLHARVWQQYAPLVRQNSRFWNAGGFDLRMGLFKGVQITAESPKTVISGGVEFATPTELAAPATGGTVFDLHEKPEDKWKTWNPAIDLHLPQQASTTNAPADSFLK